MTNNIDALPNETSIQQLTKIAITSEIGAIDHLPQEVIERIWNIYQDFIPVYLEMIRIRDNHPADWRPTNLSIDTEMVEDMLHFFSDYQHITRAFKRLNRQVKILSTLDRKSDQRRYEEWMNKILSGERSDSLFDSIIGR